MRSQSAPMIFSNMDLIPIHSFLPFAQSSRYPSNRPNPNRIQLHLGFQDVVVTSLGPFPPPPPYVVPHAPLHGWSDPQTPGSLVWVTQLWWTTHLWRDEIL